MALWFKYPISNPHSSDDGIDIGDPNDQLVAFPYGGTIIDASYHDYGGQVVEDVPGSGYSDYFIHLDKMFVKPGQHVNPGDIIGTTGGGVGDLVLHPDPGGTIQPAQSQSWYDGHSTGYHSEYGIFEGENMQEFNQGWHNKPRQLDPTPVYNALAKGQPVPSIEQLSGGAGGTSGFSGNIPPWLCALLGPAVCQQLENNNPLSQVASDWTNALGLGISGAFLNLGSTFLHSMGFTNLPNAVLRVNMAAVGAVLMLGGVGVLAAPYIHSAYESGKADAERVAGVAAKVA